MRVHIFESSQLVGLYLVYTLFTPFHFKYDGLVQGLVMALQHTFSCSKARDILGWISKPNIVLYKGMLRLLPFPSHLPLVNQFKLTAG